MIKVYAVILAISLVGLIVVILGSALSASSDTRFSNPRDRLGRRGRIALGALLGFSMGGMAAEFSPLDLSWQVALLFALVGLGLGVIWTRYASGHVAED